MLVKLTISLYRLEFRDLYLLHLDSLELQSVCQGFEVWIELWLMKQLNDSSEQLQNKKMQQIHYLISDFLNPYYTVYAIREQSYLVSFEILYDNLLTTKWSISPTFYEQLLRQFLAPKKFNLNLSTENLLVWLSYKKAA